MAEGSDVHTQLLHFFDSKTTFAADCLEQETMLPRTRTPSNLNAPDNPNPSGKTSLVSGKRACRVLGELPPRKEEGNQTLNETPKEK